MIWHSPRAIKHFDGLIAVFVAATLVSCAQRPLESSAILQLEYAAELGVVGRAQWGWQDGERTLPDHAINRITIHHGGEDFAPEKNVIEYLRTLQSWSRAEKKWIDNPYHFMIDLKGTIYEARPINLPGDTNTSYDVKGHALICVMGNYENQIVSEQQLRSLINLTAFLAKRFSVSVDSIKGHKDYTETLCPGKDLYRYLQDGSLVKGVKEKLSLQ
jgi:hypothetical protein